MSRLIDGDALKEKAWDAKTQCGYVQVIDVGDIDDAPTIEPEPKWIPCSERLPEEEYVLISKKPTKLSGSKWCVTIAIRMEDPRSRKVNWRDIGFGIIPDDNVLAWMPLPSAYMEEGE